MIVVRMIMATTEYLLALIITILHVITTIKCRHVLIILEVLTQALHLVVAFMLVADSLVEASQAVALEAAVSIPVVHLVVVDRI